MCVVWRTGKIWPKQIADCARVENLTSKSAECERYRMPHDLNLNIYREINAYANLNLNQTLITSGNSNFTCYLLKNWLKHY